MPNIVLGVLASGRGSNFMAILREIQAGRLPAVVGVVISDRPEANVLKLAAENGLPAVCIERRNFASKDDFEAAIAQTLEEYKVDLVVLAGFMRLLGGKFVQKYYGRLMNIHPSLLPAFPGVDAQRQAVEYGVKVSGCTVHFVDEGMDTGPIILQEAVPVKDDDTPESLAERILAVEHVLYPRAIKLFCENRLQLVGRHVKIKAEKRDGNEN